MLLRSAFGLRTTLRLENGLLAEHWDVIQDEATRETFEKRPTDVRRRVSRLTYRAKGVTRATRIAKALNDRGIPTAPSL